MRMSKLNATTSPMNPVGYDIWRHDSDKMRERRGARVGYIPPCEPPISGTARLLSMGASWCTLSPKVNKEKVKKRAGCGGPLLHGMVQVWASH